MIRSSLFGRIVQSVAILVPVLFTIATFYKTRAVAELEPSAAEAFAALLWLSLFHIPLYFVPRVQQHSLLARRSVTALLMAPVAIMAVIVSTGVTRVGDWIAFAGAAAWGAQYLLALASLIVHAVVVAALLWPNQPLQRTVPAM